MMDPTRTQERPDRQPRSRPAGKARLAAVAAVASLVVVVGALLVTQTGAGPSKASGDQAIRVDGQLGYRVTRGPLTISISESGSIMSRDPLVISSEVRRNVPIIFLIEEGEFVEEGDLLVELDSSYWQDEITRQSTVVENGEANLIRAREDLAIARNQAEADVSSAKLSLLFAEQDLRKYVEGEYPKQLKEAETKITLAREELKQASVRLEGSRQLYERKYISFSELEKDELAAKRQELDVEMAEEERRLLEEYTYPRRLMELENDVEQKRMALERVERRAAANILKEEADVRARESEQMRHEQHLAFLKEQLANSRIYAPKAGRVVYAEDDRDNPLEPGTDVWHRRELIHLPDRAAMVAEIKVHEAQLNHVRVGLPARITVDAVPGRVFTGRVTEIARYPDRRRWWQPDLKVYTTKVEIDVSDDTLRTGMSCVVEVLVDYFRDTVFVPVQAVVKQGGQPTVYVQQGDRFVPRVVKTGMDNNRMIRVVEGLSAGEIISLTPPLEEAAAQDTTAETSEDPDFQVEWSEALVSAARDARAEAERRDAARAALADKDVVLLERLQAAKDRGVLDRMGMSEELRETALTWLGQFENNEPIAIVDEQADEMRAAIERFVARMRNNRGGSGGEGEPGGSQSGG